MKLLRLQAQNCRNLEPFVHQPSAGLNFFIGPNAQGKTSILEAIHLVATLESFREKDLEFVIRSGQHTAEVGADVGFENEQGAWQTSLGIRLERDEHRIQRRLKKTAFRDHKPAKRVSEYRRSRFHTIVFNPADHDLIRGEPRGRRTFLNRVVCAEELEYGDILKRYQKALEQRNALLRQISQGILSREAAGLAEFSRQIAAYGAQIIYLRALWLGKLAKTINSALQRIAPEQEKLEVKYHASIPLFEEEKVSENNRLFGETFSGQGLDASLELLEKRLEIRLSRFRERETAAGVTLVGPHREDWMFESRQMPLSHRGSQGEIRSALLALKISEMDLYETRSQVKPVLLLDDFSSELDLKRREFLLGRLRESGVQGFVTTTEEQSFRRLHPEIQSFDVVNGTIS